MSRSSILSPRRTTASASSARVLGALLASMLGAVLVVMGLAGPATAHGGDVVISLGTDGQGGVSANLTWKLDGHPVEEAADVTVTAQSADGETVGPLRLMSASEGVGWYTSDLGVLAEGNWTLTATITTPSETTATAQVDVVPLPEPDQAAQSESEEDAAAAGDPAAEGDPSGDAEAADGATDDGATSAGVWIAVAVVAALLLAGAVVVVRRRSRGSGPTSGTGSRPLTSTSAR